MSNRTNGRYFSRRRFVAATLGTATAGAAVGASKPATEDDVVEVTVGAGGNLVFDPDTVVIDAGTTVRFIWGSDHHNVNVQSGPDNGWEGYDDLENTGFEYEHTFEVEGRYEYVCDTHVTAGMEGEIIVGPSGASLSENEILVGPNGDHQFTPASLKIPIGTTIEFVWESDNHNINVQSGPDEGWQGHDEIEDAGFVHDHMFIEPGRYEYVCDPHATEGMDGEIIVESKSKQVAVGRGGDLVFNPESLTIPVGTTVEFIWESDNHNINVQSGPDEGWDGYDPLEDTGFEYEHTFEVPGTYEYVCDPHVAAGMEGEITVIEEPIDDGTEESTDDDTEAPTDDSTGQQTDDSTDEPAADDQPGDEQATADADADDDSIPGFGVGTALGGLGGAGYLLSQRRGNDEQ